MRLVVLVDNRAEPGLIASWGLSIYVEASDRRLLFDAGDSPDTLCDNAFHLNVELSRLEAAVLSHWHRDHYGGFPCVAERAPHLRVYTPPGPVSILREPGLDVYDVEPESDVVVLHGVAQIVGPVEAWSGFYEQALLVREGGKAVLLLGCSHPGPAVLAERASKLLGGRRLDLVIGGLHEAPPEQLDRLVELAAKVAPIHCSGAAARYIENEYPDQYVEARAGTVIEL